MERQAREAVAGGIVSRVQLVQLPVAETAAGGLSDDDRDQTVIKPPSDPSKCARLMSLARVSPEIELAAVASLAQHTGSSALVIAELSGDFASLGRLQRPGRSLAPRELRRLTGGRSTRYGDGVVSLTALAPSAQAWLSEPGPLSGPRLLNRLVRGLLAGLARLGLAASYPGRDFVVANGRRIACVSLAREASGVLLFQAVLGVGSRYTTAEREPSWPGLPAAPEPTWLERERGAATEFAPISAALATGFAERFALELDFAPLSADEERALAAITLLPVVDAELEGLCSAGALATPIGELEAHVALDGGGRFARVRLRGDWIAAQPDLIALEAALVGELPTSARVRELCADWLSRPAALVIGLTDTAQIVDALAQSARAYSLQPSSSRSS